MGWEGRGLPKAGDACTVGEPISRIPGIPPTPVPLPAAVGELAVVVGEIPFMSCDGGKGMGISEMDGVCIRPCGEWGGDVAVEPKRGLPKLGKDSVGGVPTVPVGGTGEEEEDWCGYDNGE